jgi:uncharacterized protein YhfF
MESSSNKSTELPADVEEKLRVISTVETTEKLVTASYEESYSLEDSEDSENPEYYIGTDTTDKQVSVSKTAGIYNHTYEDSDSELAVYKGEDKYYLIFNENNSYSTVKEFTDININTSSSINFSGINSVVDINSESVAEVQEFVNNYIKYQLQNYFRRSVDVDFTVDTTAYQRVTISRTDHLQSLVTTLFSRKVDTLTDSTKQLVEQSIPKEIELEIDFVDESDI